MQINQFINALRATKAKRCYICTGRVNKDKSAEDGWRCRKCGREWTKIITLGKKVADEVDSIAEVNNDTAV